MNVPTQTRPQRPPVWLLILWAGVSAAWIALNGWGAHWFPSLSPQVLDAASAVTAWGALCLTLWGLHRQGALRSGLFWLFAGGLGLVIGWGLLSDLTLI